MVNQIDDQDIALMEISRLAYMEEDEALGIMLSEQEIFAQIDTAIVDQARAWTREIKKQGLGHGVESFLQAYGLDTEEGVALMSLAEALLRIPDSHTADALIRGTFEGRNWQHYVHNHGSWLVNLSSWGLLLTGKVVDFGQDPGGGMMHRLQGFVNRTSEPVIRQALKKAMTLIGGQFVLGETLREAIHHSAAYTKQGYRFSYDILGEGARSDDTAKRYVQSYLEGIALIAASIKAGTSLEEAPGISIKLSALHARYQLTQEMRVMTELLPRLTTIVMAAKKAGISVSIDAEESSRLDMELAVFEQLLSHSEFSGWNGIGFVVQAYQKRAFYIIDWLAELARVHHRIIPVRLVKGAYWDSEIKWAQTQGLPSYPVFTRKEHTDASYLACAHKILKNADCFYPQFATHNARSAASVVMLANHYGWKKGDFEFQRLHGMGETLHRLLTPHAPSRIYAPVGAHKDLLAYLIRRLLENGANSSFVHLLMDESKTEDEILADPISASLANVKSNSNALPLPAHIYGAARTNSAGIDFGNRSQLRALESSLLPYKNAANFEVADTDINSLNTAIAMAKKHLNQWQKFSVETRATILERAADLIESNRAELIALFVFEAGKTLSDGLAELREAADFCRYYASQARRVLCPQSLQGAVGESNVLSLHPRGIIACISPWNFPLAIFTGQLSAGLVTGNAVIAKPAEQTPRIALRAVELLHEAGVPLHVLTLAIGDGKTIGASLVAHPDIHAVVFTGSVETAHAINRALALRPGPIIPFIAETGGQNCMVVDSSALVEHAVDDIILSAFGSAGQRCSALRVVFVDEHIADTLCALLKGAMQELVIGNPAHASTDIGPVIDTAAQKMLEGHIERLSTCARFVANTPLSSTANGAFVSPHAFEINSISDIPCEIFGPILHIIRYKSEALEDVAAAVNSTGYGLTFGIHSRIDEHIRFLVSRVNVGNIYINRSMTGAVVGVQPFGGEGLSGTGPKSGGPYYLARLMTERVVTTNTASIGGNLTLLTG